MATLPAEQVTQRNKIGIVSITDGSEDTTVGETLWMSTTTLPYTVVNTKSVVSDQLVRQTLEDRVMADFYDDKDAPGGQDVSGLELVKLSDTTLAAANSTITSKDIAPFVSGGFGTLAYTLDASSVIDLAGASAVVVGSVLQYTSGAVDGTDSAVVRVTDSAGEFVLVTCVVTVA